MGKKSNVLQEVEAPAVEAAAESAQDNGGAGNAPTLATPGTVEVVKDVETVTMEDGRIVTFKGGNKCVKEATENGNGGFEVRFDFRNGRVLKLAVNRDHPLFLQFAMHGALQKVGDEGSAEKDPDDMYIAKAALCDNLNDGRWGKQRISTGGGFAGAALVIQAICTVSGKSPEEVRRHIEKRIEDAAAEGKPITRAAIYNAFKNPETKVGKVYVELKAAAEAKKAKAPSNVPNGDSLLDGLLDV